MATWGAKTVAAKAIASKAIGAKPDHWGPKTGVAPAPDPADLTLVVTASAAEVAPSGSLDFEIDVANLGDVDADNVVVEATLTDCTYDSSAGTGWTIGETGGVVTAERAALASGAAPTITISVTAAASGTATCDVTATADGLGTDMDSAAVPIVDPPDPPSVVAAGTAVSVGSTGTLAVVPGTHQTGDLLVLVMEANTGGAAQTFSDAAGFVELDSVVSAGTNTTELRVWTKTAASESETGPTFAEVASDGHKYCRMFTVRHPDGTPQIEDTTDDTSGSSTSVTIPAATSSGSNRLVLSIVTWATDSAAAQTSSEANATLGTLTEEHDAGTTTGDGGGFAVFSGVASSAGSTGATTCTLAAASVQARRTIVIAPPGT